MSNIPKAAIEAAAKALAGGEFDLELSEETDAAAEARDEKNRAEGHDDYGYPKSREKFSRGAEAAMLAASPEPPASVSESPDSSAEPMMTDEEIAEFIKENGQPEDTFPYLRVPLTPAADPVNAQDDSPAAVLHETMENLHAHDVIDDKTMKRFQPADPIRAQLVEALKALLLHTGIADVDDRDKDPDDIVAERKARAALSAAEDAKE